MLYFYHETGDTLEFYDIRDSIVQNPELTGNVVGFLIQDDSREVARKVLVRWIELHPWDTVALRMLTEI